MKINCFILDDEYFSRNILKDHIAKVSTLKLVGESEDSVTAYQAIKDSSADLLFLDIDMPDISGISFLKHHKDLPLTIMTTAHPEFALETYKFKVADYLLKPVSFEDFYRAVTKAQDYLNTHSSKLSEENTDSYFFVKTGTSFAKVVYDDLLFAEAKDNFVELHTTVNKVLVSITFKEIEQHLNKRNFVKIHKSYIVNVNNVENIDNDELKIGGNVLPISRNYRNNLISAIQNKIIKRI